MKVILWVFAPILGDDGKPSIKRLLALFFSYQFYTAVQKVPADAGTLWAVGGMVCILLGITTYQTVTSNKPS
jgi:hypothetical protein